MLMLWIALLCVLAFFYLSPGVEWRSMQCTLGVLGLTHSIVGFWRNGGSRISAQGIALFGTGLFVYYPAVSLALNPGALYADTNLTPGTFLVLFCQVVVYYLLWAKQPNRHANTGKSIRPKPSGWILPTGIALASTGILLSQTQRGIVVGDAAAYIGIILIAINISWSKRFNLATYILLTLACVAYLELIFTGLGRLRLGSLGLAILCLIATRWRGRTVKAVVIAAIWPALSYMAADRVEWSSIQEGRVSTASGMESVVGPMVRFSQLMDLMRDGTVDLAWGHTFVASLVAYFPRTFWPDKPVGFGSEVALIFRPELVPYGHSELALLHGELVYNFGLPGLVLTLLFLGWYVNRLDRVLIRAQSSFKQGATLRRALLVAVVVVLVASLVDLVWGGTFTYVARVGVRVLLLLGLAGVVSIFMLPSRRPVSKRKFRPVDSVTRRVDSRPANRAVDPGDTDRHGEARATGLRPRARERQGAVGRSWGDDHLDFHGVGRVR